MRRFVLATLTAAALGLAAAPVAAVEGVEVPKQQWSFQGLFGTFDRGALHRGFQVYNEVCSACHGLSLLSYRNLQDIGFTEDQVKAIAAQKTVTDGPDDQGEMYERPAIPSDRFVSPFPNDEAARAANGGALPPDLSLVAESREGGVDYLYGLLVGYEEPPQGVEPPAGMYYNAYFPGHLIAMPPPLSEDLVQFADGTPATVEQMAHDVSTFLAWAAEPNLEVRKQTGVKTILFLIVLTGLLYASKRKIWQQVH